MQEWTFSVILSQEMTDDLAEALYEAGCDDGTCCQTNGVPLVRFTRDAESLEEALRSAVADVLKAGCAVKRVQIESDSPPLAGLTGKAR